ncbi:hypothetical protein OOZ15_03115 [Galbibacter sp. EGI 63066]|uniref:DUF6789 family protein n=1 Tax=Galbibacter sp. EGI 63066 TaxID=2993559 RepID=UPI0022494CFC|nr:DUF6789 family protein [Galbibacter sp. EGI 63066]MCX2678920.1 hypothetical protein [Galbibacter sp. EGI 63066]
MEPKIKRAIVGGIVATVVMTLIMVIGAMMGMPKMNPPAMLSGMMGVPLAIGWMMHFMIGVIFALSYVLFFEGWVRKISSNWMKGILFGLAAFVFAQVMMGIMGAVMGGIPSPDGSPALIMVGSIVGHIVFGITVTLFLKEYSVKQKLSNS